MHEGQKPYKCHICNKSFVQSSNYRVHLNTHKEKKDRMQTCDLCGKVCYYYFLAVLFVAGMHGERWFGKQISSEGPNFLGAIRQAIQYEQADNLSWKDRELILCRSVYCGKVCIGKWRGSVQKTNLF